jgi:hypothetical protein
MSDAKVLTFIHRFSRTLQCQMRVVDFSPERECPLQYAYKWTGRPKPKDFAEYRQWILSTIAILALRWKQQIVYCLRSSTCVEIWSFEQVSFPS